MRNPRADILTVIGVGAGLFVGAPIVVPVFLCARAVRFFLDKQEDKEERKDQKRERRGQKMRDDYSIGFPSVLREPTILYYPESRSPENPLTGLSHSDPVRAHDVFIKESQDRLTEGIANSAVAIEFAKKGWGTYAATRRKKSWFFENEITETIIDSIR